MRFPFASKRGSEDQAIGVPGMGPSENRQQVTVFAPKVTFCGMKRLKPVTTSKIDLKTTVLDEQILITGLIELTVN
jgi:hypothetical protein